MEAGMKAIRCEICGSADVVKQNGLFECRYCGAKYSPEEVRNLIGSVRIDRTEETENYLTLARRSLNESNFEKAEEYFELILRNDPNHLEAVFFRPFCAAMQAEPENLRQAAGSFRQSLRSVFEMIGTQDGDDPRISSFVELVFDNALYFCASFYTRTARAYPPVLKAPGAVERCAALSEGMEELAALYEYLAQTVKEKYPENTARLRRIREDELAFYDCVGKYFMKAVPLMREKKRLKKELRQDG